MLAMERNIFGVAWLEKHVFGLENHVPSGPYPGRRTSTYLAWKELQRVFSPLLPALERIALLITCMLALESHMSWLLHPNSWRDSRAAQLCMERMRGVILCYCPGKEIRCVSATAR
jgi:hypothetical protein